MYIMIKNANGQHCEYNCTSATVTETVAIQAALETYIVEKLGGYDSMVFPVSETLWTDKIKPAVGQGLMVIADKINLLNSLCRNPALKITGVFTGYTLAYGEDKAIEVTE